MRHGNLEAASQSGLAFVGAYACRTGKNPDFCRSLGVLAHNEPGKPTISVGRGKTFARLTRKLPKSLDRIMTPYPVTFRIFRNLL